MLTLRCTAKMLKKFSSKGDPKPLASSNALGDWFGNLFKIGRKEYFLFTNSRSLISIVTSAHSQIPLSEFVPHLYELLVGYGVTEKRVDTELKTMSPITLVKTNDRSVLGSMNDFIRHLRFKGEEVGSEFDPTSPDIHHALWELPMGALDYNCPVDVALNILEGRDPLTPSESREKRMRDRVEGTENESKKKLAAKASPALTVMRPDGSSKRYVAPVASDLATRKDVQELVAKSIGSDESPIFTLRDVFDISDDPGGDLAWLVVNAPEERVFMHAVILLFSATEEDYIPADVAAVMRTGVIRVLEAAMYDPDVPDRRKIVAGPLLARMGAEIPEDEYASCFNNLEASMEEWSSTMPPPSATSNAASLYLDSATVPMEADACPADPEDKCWDSIAGVAVHSASKDPGAAALILCAASASAIWQGHKNIEALRSLLEQFSSINSPEVLWQLEVLAHWPYAGVFGEAARRSAQEIRARGIQPRHAFEPEFSHGYLSMVDGAGARQMALFYRTQEGGMDATLHLPKDTWGLKDSFPTFGDSTRIENIFHDESIQIVYAPCAPKFGREIIADAMARSLETGNRIPPNAFLCLQYLGQDLIVPKCREPNLGTYMLEVIRRTPEMVADSSELMDSVPFEGLWFSGEAAYDFIESNLKGRKTRLPDKAFEEYLREVCILERDQILRRMAANLELESLAGRATRKESKIAARTYLALLEEVVPFHHIPYIRLLAAHSVKIIQQNLKNGYREQEEANKAAMDMDEGMFEMFRNIFNPFGGR